MKKRKKVFLIILLTIVAVFVIYLLFIKKIDGKFKYTSPAKDDKFGVSFDSPILIRKVEMVQYHKNDDGNVEMVFSNYHLDSFDEYVNPDFPDDIHSEVFYSEDIQFSQYKITADIIKVIAYDDNISKVDVNDFQLERDISEYGLVYSEGALVSASNEWKVGEIKITYSYIDPLNEYVITSLITNNTINYNPFFNISMK